MAKATRPHVESIRHNIRIPGGLPVQRTLGRLTCIIGPPGSGKTSDIHAIELALSGSADDVAGRDGVKSTALIGALAEGDDGLTAHAVFSDKRESVYLLEPKRGGGFRKPALPRFGGALVHREIDAFIKKGGPAARKVLLGWISSGVEEGEVLAEISSKFHARWRDIIAAKGKGKKPLEQLAIVGTYAKDQAAQAKATAKQAVLVADAISANPLAAPTVDELDQSRMAQQQAQRDLEAAVKAQGAEGIDEASERTMFQGALDAAKAWGAEEDRHMAEIQAHQNPPREKLEPANDPDYYRAIIEVLAASVTSHQCGVCGNALAEGHPHAVKTWAEQNIARLDEKNAASISARAVKVASLLADATSAKGNAHQWAQTAAQHRQRLQQAIASPDSQYTIVEARQRLTDAGEQRSALQVRAAEALKAAQARRRSAAPSQQADDLGELATECENAAKVLLSRHVAGFTAQVRKYLPSGPTWEFAVDVNAAGGGVRVGLQRGKYLHTGLCGTEMAMVIPALACAVADFMPIAEPALMVVSDRAFSKARLTQMMKALAKFNGQVIVQTVFDPGSRGLRDWTRLEHEARDVEALYADTTPAAPIAPPTTATTPAVTSAAPSTTSAPAVKAPPAPPASAPRPAAGTLPAPPPPPASVQAPAVPDQTRLVLREFGYTDEDIAAMTLTQASDIIVAGTFKG